MADLTKSQAEQSQAAFMRTMNGGDEPEPGRTRPLLVTEFVNQVYLPFQRGKWKGSTAETSEQRIRTHIIQDLGNQQMEVFTPRTLQAFLEEKAPTSSFSLVDHLRWDLSSIFEMAVAERVIAANPATRLYTPSAAKKGACPTMNATDVEMALNAVELREKVILHLAIFSGLRPGEILALQRCNVAADGSSVGIEQRVYRGDLDTPKNGKTRVAAVPPRAATMLAAWLEAAVDPEPTAWVFASKTEKRHSGGTICSAVTFALLWRRWA
jgi:integrase